MGKFDEKVAMVTGGGSGIGLATALAFAKEGARMVIADVQDEAGQNAVKMVQDAGSEAIYVKTDVSQESDVQNLIQKTVQAFGGLDIAVNNAGVPSDPDLSKFMDSDLWHRMINVNLTGVFLCMKYEIPEMVKRCGGAIVNTSSTMGLVGRGFLVGYAAAKHGILGITKSLALTHAKDNIRINAICPGTTHTILMDYVKEQAPEVYNSLVAETPMGRLARPEEIANSILWLCSDEASYCTGHPLVVDGGFLAQ